MNTSDTTPPATSGLTLQQAVKIAAIVMLFLTAQTTYTAYTNSWNWSNYMNADTLIHVVQGMAQATLLGALGSIPRTIQVLVVFWAQPSLWSMIISVLQGIPQAVSSLGQRFISLFKRDKSGTSAN